MFRRDANGLAGTKTVRFGRSFLTIDGHLDRTDIRRIRQALDDAEQYYRTAGYYDSGDLLDDFAKGAAVAGEIAQNPYAQQLASQAGPYGSQALDYLGTASDLVRQLAAQPPGTTVPAAAGPYGAATAQAALGDPDGLQVLQNAGVGKEYALMVAQLTSPVPAIRRVAEERIRQMNAAAAAGNTYAQADRAGLQGAVAQHQINQVQDLQLQIAALRQRLARYEGGSAVPGAGARGTYAGLGGFGGTSGPAISSQLRQAVAVAIARTRLDPQPSFRIRRPRGGRA